MGQVLAVNVVHALLRDGATGRLTAIDKRPVDGDVTVGPLGMAGDAHGDTRHHGGVDKAVYAYAAEDLRGWAQRLGRELTPGQFGENLTLEGVDISGARIGEQWRIGDVHSEQHVVLEVTMPRTPCATFQRRMGERQWVRRFTEIGATGAYLRVLRPGVVRAGDAVEVVRSPGAAQTVRQVFDASMSRG